MAKRGVTLSIEEEVWRRSRAMALLNGLTVSAVVEEFLREWSGLEGSNGDAAAESGSAALEQDEAGSVRQGDLGVETR